MVRYMERARGTIFFHFIHPKWWDHSFWFFVRIGIFLKHHLSISLSSFVEIPGGQSCLPLMGMEANTRPLL